MTAKRSSKNNVRFEHVELDASGDAMACFAEATELAFIFIDHEGRVAFTNRAAEYLFGHRREAMLGRALDLIIPERFRSAHQAGVERVRAGLPSKLAGRTVEIMGLHADGHEVPIEISMSAWHGREGVMMSGVIRDVSERRERDRRLARFARHDPLTGLPNRILLVEQLQSMLDAKSDVTVILIGLDGIRKINGDLGHKAGDTILQSLAIRLPGLLPKQSMLCRAEGSMFAAILPGIGNPVQAQAVAADLLRVVNTPFSIGEHVVRVHANAGFAIGPAQAGDAEELIASADLALLRAPGTSGSARLFEPAMRGAGAARRAMNDEIRHAVEDREFELYFQPQVDLNTGAIVGAEALLRWNHRTRGVLAPAAFLAALEAHTLSAQVGDWIIDEACRQVASWRRSRLPSARVSVNLFAGQLGAGNLPEIVRDALKRHKLPPESLELEVTETTVLGVGDNLDEQFRRLREAKVRIAFDDFGTGHASLSLLKQFPITTIKIDRSFIRDIERDRFDRAIVLALLEMSRTMGLDVVAEGIETAEQQAKLVAMGCRFGQGYFYARPLTSERFLQFCATDRSIARSA